MQQPLRLTPTGSSRDVTRTERRRGWALVDEAIRHELAERHAAHWPRYRPSARRVTGARLAARRRQLLVVTDADTPTRRVIAAATCRSSSPRFGRSAAAALRVARHCTKGTVILVTMLALLLARRGAVGISALGTSGVLVALATAPLFATVRVRLADRVLAARAERLCGLDRNDDAIVVLHQFTFPQDPRGADAPRITAALVAAALCQRGATWHIAAPCCADLASRYASAAGVVWLPLHARVDRSVIVFAPGEDVAHTSTHDVDQESTVTSLDRFRSASRAHKLEPV